MPAIILNNKGMTPEVFPLGKAILLIGRHPDSEVLLDSFDISRNHASIVHSDGQYLIRDNGSTNGTYVNGKPVSSQILAHDDEISFGPYCFRVDLIEEKSAPGGRDKESASLERNGQRYADSTSLLPVKGHEASGSVKVMMAGRRLEVPVSKKTPFPIFVLSAIGAIAIIAWYLQRDENIVMASRHQSEIAGLKSSTAAQVDGLTAELKQARDDLRSSKEDLEKTLSQISMLQDKKAANVSQAAAGAPSSDRIGASDAESVGGKTKPVEELLQYPPEITFTVDKQLPLMFRDKVAGSINIRKGRVFPVLGVEEDVVLVQINGETVRVPKLLTNFESALEAINSSRKKEPAR